MKKTITNPLMKVVFLAVLTVLLFSGKSYSQLVGGQTYYVNGATDVVAPRDTFPSLMGGSTTSTITANSGIIHFLNTLGVDIGGNRLPITIILTTGYNPIESAPISIGGASGGYPNMSDSTKAITLKTNGQSFAITTNGSIGANGSLVRFNGIRWFTIDGSGAGNTRAISFVMPAAATTGTTKVVDLTPSTGTNASGIQYVSINNCNIIGSSTTTLSNTFAGIYVGGITGTPSVPSRGRNAFISFTNNNILGTQNGIYYRGFTTSNGQQDDRITISNNIIGGYSFPTLTPGTLALAALGSASVGSGTSSPSGIYASAIKNAVIDGNVIRNNFKAATNYRAINLFNEGSAFSLDSNIQIVNNQIYNLFSNAAGNGISGIRINMGSHTQQLRMLVANNSIAKIIAYGSSNANNLSTQTVGIMLESTTSNAGLEIYYNSINLNQDTMLVNSQSTCLGMAAGVTGGVICMNNILSNTMGSANNSCLQVGSTSGWPFTYINYNNYYVSNIRAGIHSIANLASSNILALSGFLKSQSLKNFRLYSPSDSLSISTPPAFSNDTICTFASGLNHLNYNRGIHLINNFTGIPVYSSLRYRPTTDMFGNQRTYLVNGNQVAGRFSSIGCHHWNGDSTNPVCPLNSGAIYLINNVDNPPTLQNPSNGTFRNITQAINHINSYGVGGGIGGPITFEVRKGYTGEPGYLPALNDYLGTSFATPIVFRVANDTNITITMPNLASAPNFSSVINFTGASYVTFDGRANKNIRFAIPSLAVSTTYRVIGITPLDTGSSNITIRNCVIAGNSSATSVFTSFGIYMGTRASLGFVTLNSNLNNYTFTDNIIQSVGNGIAIRSLGSSSGHNISRNLIGGTIPTGTGVNTTFIGGTVNFAGIYLKGVQSTVVDSNIIRNCVPDGTSSNGFRGIDLDETSSTLTYSGIDVTRNFIYNLNTLSGAGCYGIRLALLTNDATRSITFLNNYISRIGGVTASPTGGASAAVNAANPAGIFIDGTISATGTPAISLLHNTVVMNMPVLGTNPGGTSCVYIGSNMKTGISMSNNILGNTGNRPQVTSTSANNKICLIVVGNVNPFAANTILASDASNKNNYFVSGIGAGTLISFNNNTQLGTNIFDVRRFNSTTIPATTNVTNDIGSFSYPVSFPSDTLPNINTATASLVYGTANTLPTVCKDIYGNPRQGCPGFNVNSGVTGRCVGAVEFDRSFVPFFGGGTYLIDGAADNPPTITSPQTGSFGTVRSAINYLNANGVEGAFGGVLPVKLLLSNGYVGETDTFLAPISVLDYPRANPNRPVVLSVIPNRFDTIRVASNKIARGLINASLIRLSGAAYFEINGDNGTGSRGLTLLMPQQMAGFSNRVVDLIGGNAPIATSDSSNSNSSIKNCNIIGVSSTFNDSTFAGIYMGGVNIVTSGTTAANLNARYGRNSYNTFDNNFIGGVQYGIYMRGRTLKSEVDNGNVISNNVIGGDIAPSSSSNTNYWGGLANAAGISVNGQSNLIVTSNIIKNNIPSFGNNRGIEVTVWPVSGTSAANTSIGNNITIEKNEIYRIVSNVAPSGAMGIVLNYGGTGIADSTNLGANIAINNNRISGIRAQGTALVSATASTFTNNVFGILIDAPSVVMRNGGNTQLGVSLNYNSVNLGQSNTLSGTNVLSAALGISQNIRGGISARNNIFQNKLGVASGTGNDVFGVAVGGTVNPFNNGSTVAPFSNIDYNNYYASNPSAGATVAHFASSVQITPTAPILYNTWDRILGFTLGDTASINFVAPFTNDTNLFIPGVVSPLFRAGIPVSNIFTDAFGNSRNVFNPTIGAHEFSGSAIDSVQPRIFNYSDPTACYAQGIVLNYQVNDGFLLNDTLYYIIDNGTEQSVQSTIFNGNQRIYTIPNQVPGTLIRVRVSSNDFAGNNGRNPMYKSYDTISTSISNFPYANGFEGGNVPYWQVINLTGNATWSLGQTGSAINPSAPPYSGLRTANFNSSTFTANSSARLLSPCFDFTNMKNPTLRFAFYQSNNNPTQLDNLDIKVGIGNYYGSVANFVRVNSSFAFPNYKVFEVCLANFAGLQGIRIAFDGIAAGAGQNLLIDSIQIFDDFQSQAISPKFLNACFRDSASFTLTGSDPRFVYSSYDLAKLGNSMIDYSGTGSSLTYKLPPNRSADTIQVVVNAVNTLSGCSNYLPDTVSLAIGRFYNGPYVAPRVTAFTGAFNDGTSFFPDGARVGDTLTYEIKAPSFLTNADYGTLWEVANYSLKTSTGTSAQDFTLLPGNASTRPALRFIAQASELNSTFNLNLSIRLLTTGCDSSYSRVLSVISTPVPQLISSVDTVCALTNLLFTGNSLSAPGDGPYNFIWSFGDNSSAGTQLVQKAYLAGGLYTVRLTVGNRLGITGSATKQIFVRTSPTVNFTYDLPCTGDASKPTSFKSNTQPVGSTYLWSFPGSSQTTANANFYFDQSDTTYSVKLKIRNTEGCEQEQTQNQIYVFARPTARFTTSNVCLGVKLPLTDSSTIGSGSVGRFWDFGNGDISLGATPTYKYPASGTYLVTLIARSNYGCADTLRRTATIFDKPVANFKYTTACASGPGTSKSQPVDFTNTSSFSGGFNNVNYSWNLGDNTTYDGVTPNKTYSSIADADNPFFVKLVATEINNGCKDSITLPVIVSYKPVAQFTASRTTVCNNSAVVFNNSSRMPDNSALENKWTFSGLNGSTEQSPTFVFNGVNNYNVQLIVKSVSSTCSDTAYLPINVVPAPSVKIKIDSIGFGQRRFKMVPTNVADSISPTNYIWTINDLPRTTFNVANPSFYFDKGKQWYTITLRVDDGRSGCSITAVDSFQNDNVGINDLLANKFGINAYPNPFTEITNLDFTLDESRNVNVTVLDMLGRSVSQHAYGKLAAGKHSFRLEENEFSSTSSTYLIKIEFDDTTIYRAVVKQK
jgi:hypothetical protein